MANLNITKIAHDLLGGLSQRIYHQDLMKNPRLRFDCLGLGDFAFNLDNHPGQNPRDVYGDKGLLTSVERGAVPSDNPAGHMGVIDMSNIDLPREFVLTGTFVRPKKTDKFGIDTTPGEYAAVVLFDYEYVDSQTGETKSTETGVTSRFTTDDMGANPSQHLNVLGYGRRFWPGPPGGGGFPPIDDSWYKQVTAAVNPSVFTVVLHVKRSDQNAKMKAWLYVGDELVQRSDDAQFPMQTFDGMTAATAFDKIRVGVGTAQGMMPPHPAYINYSASVYLNEFEIWAPISGPHWMKALHSLRYAYIDDPSSDHNLMQGGWDANDNQRFDFTTVVNMDTGDVSYNISPHSPSGLLLTDTGLDGDGNRKITLSPPVAGAASQEWKLVPATDPADGTFHIWSKSSGWVMDVKGGSPSPNVRVIQWHFSGFANQRWFLIPSKGLPVEHPPPPVTSRGLA